MKNISIDGNNCKKVKTKIECALNWVASVQFSHRKNIVFLRKNNAYNSNKIVLITNDALPNLKAIENCNHSKTNWQKLICKRRVDGRS